MRLLPRRRPIVAPVALVAGLTLVPALALPLMGPNPAERSDGVAISELLGPIGSATADAAPAAVPPDPSRLDAVLDPFVAGDVGGALLARDALPKTALEWRVATWVIATTGGDDVPLTVFDDALAELSNWPGQSAILDAREEAALASGGATALLGSTAPRTTNGKLAVAKHLASTDSERAASVLAPLWRSDVLSPQAEADILSWGPALLEPADHRARMTMLLYRERIRGAERVAAVAGPGAVELVRAVGAVARRSGEADALAAVPASLRSDPLYLYASARHLRRSERHEAAAQMLAEAVAFSAVGTDGGAWWEERSLLARQLLNRGEPRLAYVVAAGQSHGSATDRIEAQFTAGWIALRHLSDADIARRHFAAILELGTRALSVSRGAYWLGRAEEELGDGIAARIAYARAAALPVTFYGQLAAERLGSKSLSISYPAPTEADRSAFAASEFVRAIDLLEASDHGARARTLYRHLAGRVPTAGQAALLTARAERAGQHRLSLQMGKTALARGLDAAALAFPVGAIPGDAPLSETGRALAYAIARQESGFDRSARSGAGALGLLQLMPATAREVAGWMDLPYSRERLTSDPGYNAALGARFLSRLLDRFDQSYVLAVAAYNAGPTRAIRWRRDYGDPVGATPDEVVDWIERIPFSETRNYVQRVMENYQVYRARLDGRAIAIERDLSVGRQ